MRKWICRGMAVLLLFLPLTAWAEEPPQENRLTVYTSHKEEVYLPIVEEFERRTGIWIQVVEGGSRELLDRIAREQEQPEADVMFGGGVESLLAYEQYFAPCRVDKTALLESCRFVSHPIVAFSRLPLVIIYNPRIVSQPPKGWMDLTQEGYRGQIAFADPAVSGSSYTALATFVQVLGEGAPFQKLARNIRGYELSGSGKVVSSVAGGSQSVGITLFETAQKRMLDGEYIGIVWPEEGTSAVPDGAAMIAGCLHPDNAEAFLSFILSDEVQQRVQKEFQRESVLTRLSQPQHEQVICPYDVEWAAKEQNRLLSAWQAFEVQP